MMDKIIEYIELTLIHAFTISDWYESFDAATSAEWGVGTHYALRLTMEIASAPDSISVRQCWLGL
jgi:hypothetical protein